MLKIFSKVAVFHNIFDAFSFFLRRQEVETCEYHAFFVPQMAENGYEGIFSPKSRAKHMGEDEKRHVDGCAIFWKTNK